MECVFPTTTWGYVFSAGETDLACGFDRQHLVVVHDGVRVAEPSHEYGVVPAMELPSDDDTAGVGSLDHVPRRGVVVAVLEVLLTVDRPVERPGGLVILRGAHYPGRVGAALDEYRTLGVLVTVAVLFLVEALEPLPRIAAAAYHCWREVFWKALQDCGELGVLRSPGGSFPLVSSCL